MIELKPCPFCGGNAYIGNGRTWVRCVECGAETGCYDTEEEAIEAWNRRVGDPSD